ncbi:MAG TPA: hypothetical protein VJL34_01210, partial [Anaerolineales bacterium]|nr:hypothetical protein [Anaerolineales bacterium]
RPISLHHLNLQPVIHPCGKSARQPHPWAELPRIVNLQLMEFQTNFIYNYAESESQGGCIFVAGAYIIEGEATRIQFATTRNWAQPQASAKPVTTPSATGRTPAIRGPIIPGSKMEVMLGEISLSVFCASNALTHAVVASL